MFMKYDTKYHKTGQYRNAVRALTNYLTFNGLDDSGDVIKKPIENPYVEFLGSVKLHGTNANIVLHENGSITLHSKEQQLAYISNSNEFELFYDNANFAQEMYSRLDGVRKLFDDIISQVLLIGYEVVYPIKLSGEWCGKGIQKGVGVSQLENKTLFLFDVKLGNGVHFRPCLTKNLSEYHIYFLGSTYSVMVDLNMPDKATIKMKAIVEQVEKECPVAKMLGVEDCLIGEGVVWTPKDPNLYSNTEFWFKTKGQAHSTSKVKKLVSANPEKVESIEKFIEYAVTDNRLKQGLEHVSLDVKNTGEFIGWINRDIYEEESDVLEANGLTMKDVGKYISQKARDFFMSKC